MSAQAGHQGAEAGALRVHDPVPEGHGGVCRLLRPVDHVGPALPDERRRGNCCSGHHVADAPCSGDYEEHAILLCNYLLALGMEAWVALGRAIPEVSAAFGCRTMQSSQGATAYVLCRLNGTLLLWNAVKGESCPVTDYFCPLHHVCLARRRTRCQRHTTRSTQCSTTRTFGPTCSCTTSRSKCNSISTPAKVAV